MEEYTCLVDKVLALEIRPQVQDLPQSQSTERCNSEPSKVLDTFTSGNYNDSLARILGLTKMKTRGRRGVAKIGCNENGLLTVRLPEPFFTFLEVVHVVDELLHQCFNLPHFSLET